MHLDYNVSSGPFLTMDFEFDQDHGTRPEPKLDNILIYTFKYEDITELGVAEEESYKMVLTRLTMMMQPKLTEKLTPLSFIKLIFQDTILIAVGFPVILNLK